MVEIDEIRSLITDARETIEGDPTEPDELDSFVEHLEQMREQLREIGGSISVLEGTFKSLGLEDMQDLVANAALPSSDFRLQIPALALEDNLLVGLGELLGSVAELSHSTSISMNDAVSQVKSLCNELSSIVGDWLEQELSSFSQELQSNTGERVDSWVEQASGLVQDLQGALENLTSEVGNEIALSKLSEVVSFLEGFSEKAEYVGEELVGKLEGILSVLEQIFSILEVVKSTSIG